MSNGEVIWTSAKGEPWRVTVLDTGLQTMTGGRLKRAREMIGDETFCLTYGDGVSDVDLGKLVGFHREGGKLATVTAVEPSGRFGILNFDGDNSDVTSFREKDRRDVGFINGGFFVCEPEVFDLIEDDSTVWEQGPMRRLVEASELRAYRHLGFWQSMDTLRDKELLETIWATGTAPWKVWQD
jgi:glucose-1-phosphate cytidylyltransferase